MQNDEQRRFDWLRWGLEEIVRCTEPKAGSGDHFICGIAVEALRNAGFPLGAAGIQKPQPVVEDTELCWHTDVAPTEQKNGNG